MLHFTEMSCNRSVYIIPLNGAPTVCSVIYSLGTGCLTYVHFTTWALHKQQVSNKILHADALPIGRVVNRLESFGKLKC